MSFSVCKECKCPCLLISLSCAVSNSLYIRQSLGTKIIRTAIDQAQNRFVLPLLGDCFEELCAALEASHLPTADPNYVPLEQKWVDLLEVFENLVVVGTEFVLSEGTIKGLDSTALLGSVEIETSKVVKWLMSTDAYDECLCSSLETSTCVKCNTSLKTCGCSDSFLKKKCQGGSSSASNCCEEEDPCIDLGWYTTKYAGRPRY